MAATGKFTITTRTAKPRNPVALLARQRAAGPHKQGKQRQRDRQSLARSLREGRVEE